MNFFDSVLSEFYALTKDFKTQEFAPEKPWTDVGRNEFIMQRDCAFELFGTGFNIVTSGDIGQDRICVIGENLDRLKSDTPFVRVSVIGIEDISDEQKAYDTVKKIEFAKYHFFPEGFMTRFEADTYKERVRVSKKSIKNGMRFENTGTLLIKKYKENPAVKNVCVYYITAPDFDGTAAERLAKKSKSILDALNHIMKDVSLDCSVSALKPVCDEVDGLRELHFGKK